MIEGVIYICISIICIKLSTKSNKDILFWTLALFSLISLSLGVESIILQFLISDITRGVK